MNRKKVAFKLSFFTLIVILSAVFVVMYSYALTYSETTFYPKVNKGRLLTSSVMTNIEEALVKNNPTARVKSPYPFAVIDLHGKVLFSSIEKYRKGMTVNLNDFIEYDNRASLEYPGYIKYSAPLILTNKQVGSAIFLIPEEAFLPISPGMTTALRLAPIVAALLVISALTISAYLSLRKDIFAPLATLHESASRILKGDYSYKIHYDYDNEMGNFCHDFESMRDELKFSKEKELAVKANEKELLACLSHDIKTPLTAIHGYVSGIKDGIVKDKEGIDSYCTIILNRVRMLTKLLEDILEHSKAELNKMEISLSEFFCEDFFRDILDDLSVEVENKGLQFIYPKTIPNLLLSGDKKRLAQVIYNLVSNSIKYSKEHGTISIYFENDNSYIYVYIKDNGIGISSADIPKIFNKFYRGEKSRNQNIPGSGLGLSISKYVIEAHGGFINCVESSSEGTVFCFALPI
ncbi:MAG: HAMP domain-containing histidine kinase [Clostridia bacterium]|nr:HAMP domain-containing histidine kinase [Clostridia bacterium]